MDWLGKMLELPKSFLFSGGGSNVMQGTTCEAILCTLTAARDHILSQIGRERAIATLTPTSHSEKQLKLPELTQRTFDPSPPQSALHLGYLRTHYDWQFSQTLKQQISQSCL
uniref:Putative tyrosine/DOPA decarboxylase 2-like n=1 Tax=Davidia involucrata TaxID=16924 RepID=A0A5B7BVG2_DAVIN